MHFQPEVNDQATMVQRNESLQPLGVPIEENINRKKHLNLDDAQTPDDRERSLDAEITQEMIFNSFACDSGQIQL